MAEFPGFEDAAPRPPERDRSRGRGALSNRVGRFEAVEREAAHDGWDLPEDAPPTRTQVLLDRSKKVIVKQTSPDIPFDRSINPYRGCEHGCVYCFARPTHAWLGLSPGLDFETKIALKPDAPARLEEELRAKSYACKPIAIGTNTDPYQPLEKERRIMRGLLEVLQAHRHPVTIVTKGALVVRDADILGEMGRAGLARVAVSLTTLDHRLSRAMEPRAASPQQRLRAIATLNKAGCPTGTLVAPIVPALTDHEIERLLEAVSGAGAAFAGYVLLRLPLEVRELFEEWLRAHVPDRADRVLGRVRELRGGKLNDARFGTRMSGQGVWADLIRRRFRTASKRLGLTEERAALRCDLFRLPERPGDQLSLGF
ncbi:MAG: PA0069 family radical SAM protein [Pseudomonadota bacterium]